MNVLSDMLAQFLSSGSDRVVDLSMFLYGFAFYSELTQVQLLYVQKVCQVNSSILAHETYPTEVCNHIANGSFPEEQASIQATVSKSSTIVQILMQAPILIFSLFLGSWSNEHGRKLLILLPFLGETIRSCLFIVNTYFFHSLGVEFMWLEAVTAVCGSWVVFLLGVYSYVTDTSQEADRTIRMALADGCWASGRCFGQFMSGRLYHIFGIYGNFVSSSVNFFLGVLMIHYGVKNTKASIRESNAKSRIFDFDNLKKSFKSVTNQRPGNLRTILILLITCLMIWDFEFLSLQEVEFLLVRRKFPFVDGEEEMVNWWTFLQSLISAAQICAVFLLMPFLIHVLHLSDMCIAMVSVVLGFGAQCLTYILSSNRSQLYMLIPSALFSYMASKPLRSAISKVAGPQDIGGVFACVSALMSFVALAAPLMNILYMGTLSWPGPGTVPAVVLVTTALLASIMAYVHSFIRRRDQYQQIAEEC